VAQPQGAGEPDGEARALLRQASVHLTVESPLVARVDARFEIAGGGRLELLLTRLPGQVLSELRVELDGEAVETTAGRRNDPGMRRLRLPLDGGPASLTIGYSVQKTPGTPFRYPLVVPDATTVQDSRSVRLLVTLPPGAVWAGDSFPRFDRVETGDAGTTLQARLIGAPALAYVAFASGHAPLRLDLFLEISALALVAAALAWWGLRWRQSSAATADGPDRPGGTRAARPGRRQGGGTGDRPGASDG